MLGLGWVGIFLAHVCRVCVLGHPNVSHKIGTNSRGEETPWFKLETLRFKLQTPRFKLETPRFKLDTRNKSFIMRVGMP